MVVPHENEKFKLIFELLADPIILINLQGDILCVNTQVERYFGYCRQELIGQKIELLVPTVANFSINKDVTHSQQLSLRQGVNERSERVDVEPMTEDERMSNIAENSSTKSIDNHSYAQHKSGERLPIALRMNSLQTQADGDFITVIVRDLTPHRRLEEKFYHLVRHDPLTGLMNTTYFTDKLNELIQLSRVSSQRFAVIFIDIDGFKTINDKYGHTCGNALLTAITERLQHSVRDSDMFARLGGDEFACLLPNIYDHNITAIIQRLLCVFSEPFIIDKYTISVTASMGISFFPMDGGEAKTLIENADAAMYRAKEKGKNGYCYYSSAV